MTLRVVRPGVLATLQAGARTGLRQFGVPWSGPADALSMALANRLAGNPAVACALEITYGPTDFVFERDCTFALAGSFGGAILGGQDIGAHRTLFARAGSALSLAASSAGARTYLAVNGGLAADTVLSSQSTFTGAHLGGLEGRAVREGDSITFGPTASVATISTLETPTGLRPAISRSVALRAVAGPDFETACNAIWNASFDVGARADRTGVELKGPWPELPVSAQPRPSAAIFPGAIQLPPSGSAFALLPDSQTTGGYPHVLQVIRADRHLLGQLRPGDRVRFLRRTPETARDDLIRKSRLFEEWLPGFRF